MLTKKQLELLFLLDEKISLTGITPSFDEMKEKLGLKSKSGIHRIISALEERGFIRKLPFKARAIEIIKLPKLNKKRLDDKNIKDMKTNKNSLVELPIIGRIAAGLPIEAIEDKSNMFHVPSSFIKGKENFILEVKGDSMIGAGINDGDLVIVQKQSTAKNGDIVVALINDEEATLKRFRQKGNTIALEAANDDYETRIYSGDQISIQGILAGLIRSYS
jgi:repressor LexA